MAAKIGFQDVNTRVYFEAAISTRLPSYLAYLMENLYHVDSRQLNLLQSYTRAIAVVSRKLYNLFNLCSKTDP